MSLEKTWYILDDAAEKFGIDKNQILKWVEDGLVRAEESSGKVARVNLDDLELQVQEMTGI
ncbi:hypothetical protein OR1_02408 [Geobacter sp. OR-1]|uniref:MerR family transcriptional regulator n=1 Tax=Geobacter sp. OR-1 TaxID=1266765 RepID=UPI0005442ED6|nr:MerR family transcriptional regulator [Geobacter sp. OR-1]GAM10120.1 hypothetical protein OR1_02408 [Geobacter sp. OR-1]